MLTALALRMACRNEPAPESCWLLTPNVAAHTDAAAREEAAIIVQIFVKFKFIIFSAIVLRMRPLTGQLPGAASGRVDVIFEIQL